jgi:lincosamide and streptogramin A transport system ATP-binding/permease protein
VVVPTLICRGLSFAHDGSDTSLFSDLDLLIDTRWRTALVGANGRGKTTLLRLLAGELQPDRGCIERPLPCRLFAAGEPGEQSAWSAARDMAGPFRAWEAEIARLLDAGDTASIERYGILEEQYRLHGGYGIDARLRAELALLGLEPPLLQRPLRSLSGGEQTRCLLAGLFAADRGYPLIDEPTNHLDRRGREQLAAYLRDKSGFLLVSHDRAFLDDSVDHVIALNPDTVEVQRSDYSSWRAMHRKRLEQQARSNLLLRKDIARLSAAARARRDGAAAREADKTAGGKCLLPSERGGDSGFTGARAARQMKRALAAERRAGQRVAERRASLVDMEKTYPLALAEPDTPAPGEPLLRLQQLSVIRGRPLFAPLNLELRAGERLALLGPNGCGKSSLLDLLTGRGKFSVQGDWLLHSRIRVSRVFQVPRWRRGDLRGHLQEAGLDETRFRQLMAALGVRGEVLDGSIETLSQGQRKKLELARSLATPAHLYLWDEPLNYLDIDARERLETALMASGAAIVLVEHDARFVERIATRTLAMHPYPMRAGAAPATGAAHP